MAEVNKDREEHGVKAGGGVKPLARLGIVLLLSMEQKDMVGTWLRPATQHCILFKNRPCLGYIGRLV
jgi:hypothetical protein